MNDLLPTKADIDILEYGQDHEPNKVRVTLTYERSSLTSDQYQGVIEEIREALDKFPSPWELSKLPLVVVKAANRLK